MLIVERLLYYLNEVMDIGCHILFKLRKRHILNQKVAKLAIVEGNFRFNRQIGILLPEPRPLKIILNAN